MPGEKADEISQGTVFNLPSKKGAAVAKANSKDGKLISRLKKSGLDPQKLLDLALPGTTAKSATKMRHRMILLGFMLFVAMPAAAFSAYMFFWASDQYHSMTAFAVRSSQPVAATEVLGMVMGNAGGSPRPPTAILSRTICRANPCWRTFRTIWICRPSSIANPRIFCSAWAAICRSKTLELLERHGRRQF